MNTLLDVSCVFDACRLKVFCVKASWYCHDAIKICEKFPMPSAQQLSVPLWAFITSLSRTTIVVFSHHFGELRWLVVCVVSDALAVIVIAFVYCITISIRSRHYLSSIVRLGHMWASLSFRTPRKNCRMQKSLYCLSIMWGGIDAPISRCVPVSLPHFLGLFAASICVTGPEWTECARGNY